MVDPMRVILRRTRTRINKRNAAVQCFFELMNTVSPSFFDEEWRGITESFISDSGIIKGNITKYSGVFPDKAMRTLVENEIIYSIT